MKARRRNRTPMERPEVTLGCSCVLSGKYSYPSIPCPVAEELWERVAVANKNLERTRRFVKDKKGATSLRGFVPMRLKFREAIYEYRRERWRQHFQEQVTA
jgi:hypothetical protein